MLCNKIPSPTQKYSLSDKHSHSFCSCLSTQHPPGFQDSLYLQTLDLPLFASPSFKPQLRLHYQLNNFWLFCVGTEFLTWPPRRINGMILPCHSQGHSSFLVWLCLFNLTLLAGRQGSFISRCGYLELRLAGGMFHWQASQSNREYRIGELIRQAEGGKQEKQSNHQFILYTYEFVSVLFVHLFVL